MAAILPDLNELTMKDYEFVYEPSDDTFLLCDAIEKDRKDIIINRPKLVLEIG
jgi:release factor glutamine methyltransferase